MIPAGISSALEGRVLFLIPHQDDEILGCGGLIALLPDKSRLHFVFATDGASFPQPLSPRQGNWDPNLSYIREQESRKALGGLGVPQENISFLGYPDTRLRRHVPAIRRDVARVLAALQPRAVFAPFRYDRHPDHLALHDATAHALRESGDGIELVEYMVYFRWPLLGNADIRESICPDQAVVVDIASVLTDKQRALDCFASQFTQFYPWQERAGVLSWMVEESYADVKEVFIVHRTGKPLFVRNRWRHEFAHWVQRYAEWPLTRQKKRLQARFMSWRSRAMARSR